MLLAAPDRTSFSLFGAQTMDETKHTLDVLHGLEAQLNTMASQLESLQSFVDIMLWIVGVGAFTVIGWGITLAIASKRTREDLTGIVEGVAKGKIDTLGYRNEIDKTLKKHTDEVKKLSHFVQVNIKTQTGKEPEPPM